MCNSTNKEGDSGSFKEQEEEEEIEELSEYWLIFRKNLFILFDPSLLLSDITLKYLFKDVLVISSY